MFNPNYAVKIAADSWATLRKCDVYRLFNSHDPKHWKPLRRVLVTERPDLAEEAEDVLDELDRELTTTTQD
jgi:hypothetical protein